MPVFYTTVVTLNPRLLINDIRFKEAEFYRFKGLIFNRGIFKP